MPRPKSYGHPTHDSYARERGILLDELERHGNISRAVRACGLSRTTIYDWRKESSAFNLLFESARRKGLE